MTGGRSAAAVREYLNLGFDFKTLCRIIMTDADGCGMAPEKFAQMLLKMKLHVENKPVYSYGSTVREKTGMAKVNDVSSLLLPRG